MKKIIVSLAAFAALSTAALANDRTEDFNSAYRNVHFGSVDGTMDTASASAALAVEAEGFAAAGNSDLASDKLRGFEYFIERGDSGSN